MTGDIQFVFVLVWEPADYADPRPLKFLWTRAIDEGLRSQQPPMARLDPRSQWMVYAGTFPLPTDGDFVTDADIGQSLRHILSQLPRGETPPLSQVVDGTVDCITPR